jgi:hypothetical protein
MSAHNKAYELARGLYTGNAVACTATGTRLTTGKSGQVAYAKASATTTSITIPALADLPTGWSIVIDNSNGSGNFTVLNPAGSTLATVSSSDVSLLYRCGLASLVVLATVSA